MLETVLLVNFFFNLKKGEYLQKLIGALHKCPSFSFDPMGKLHLYFNITA